MRSYAPIGIAALFLVTACSQPAAIHEQAYYASHADERASEIANCRSDIQKIGKTPNCANALAAAADVESSRFWAIKPSKSRLTNPGSL